jgi:NTF2-related export protein 1/2
MNETPPHAAPDRPITNHLTHSLPAAKNFVDWYYRQINEAKSVSQGYINGHAAYDKAGHPPADICINGLVVATPQEWEKLLEQQRQAPKQPDPNKKRVRYEVEGYSVHVINADYQFGAPQKMVDLHSPTDGVRMMMTLSVSGTVYFGTGRNKGDDYWEKQHFYDRFILVPNWDVLERPGTRHGRKYLVISHNYRAN